MKTNKKTYWQYIRAIAFTGVSIVTFFSSMANSKAITDEMSAEVTAEFNKQLALQAWPEMHTKLALMDNPYSIFYQKIKISLKEQPTAGHQRRLMTEEESLLAAKKKRFDYCQASVPFFVDFAKRADNLSTLEHSPLTKNKLMQGNGVKYPFTEEQSNNGNFRPTQIALTLGWQYQGQGEIHAEEFLASCLAIPVSFYYVEDKF
ncbi:hypothetical protein CMT41_17150 [Colwellia sp. MT41]|uniref:hypothetical protein n=1 Tax=Colwellia sp. MT41 TaxID=58049 RepID=UPI0007179774|nr:hypothetical protein [Colwellia sp. MT41]ALO36265.1 hypothetical protein CMT41_17150 [Colwellia sp. MT41]